MKLLVLGATGPTGRHVVDLAVGAGDAVTVLARRPEAMDDQATRAASAVIGAAGETGVSRLVWLSSFGVGDTGRRA